MAVMVRAAGVPARMALGYTRGHRAGRRQPADHQRRRARLGGGLLRGRRLGALRPDAHLRRPAGRHCRGRRARTRTTRTDSGRRAGAVPRADAGRPDRPDRPRRGRRPARRSWGRTTSGPLAQVLIGARGSRCWPRPSSRRRRRARMLQRRRRMAAGTAGALWDELTATALDAGVRMHPAWTPRQAARELCGRHAEGRRSAWRRPAPTPSGGWPWPRRRPATARARSAARAWSIPTSPRRCGTTRRALLAAAPRRGRLRALLWPASLVTAARSGCRGLDPRPARGPGGVRGRRARHRVTVGRTTAAVRRTAAVGKRAASSRATGRSGGGSAPRGGSSAAAGRRGHRARNDRGRTGRGRRPGCSRPRRRRWLPCS